MDIVDHRDRSRMMSGIASKNTKPEMFVRKQMFAAGLRFRLHRSDLAGTPDIVLIRKKVAIFINGCFWHQHAGCRYVKLPASNSEFWNAKLLANVERDQVNIATLLSLGWRVLVIWECATRDESIRQSIGYIVKDWVAGDDVWGEISAIKL